MTRPMRDVSFGDLTISNDRPLTLICGPCQLESADHAQMIAGRMQEICREVGAQFGHWLRKPAITRSSAGTSRRKLSWP